MLLAVLMPKRLMSSNGLVQRSGRESQPKTQARLA